MSETKLKTKKALSAIFFFFATKVKLLITVYLKNKKDWFNLINSVITNGSRENKNDAPTSLAMIKIPFQFIIFYVLMNSILLMPLRFVVN